MVAKSYNRGHEMKFNYDLERWCYVDNGKPVASPDRPCGRCGKNATPEGHDACMANLPGVVNACCGHGHGLSYIMFEDGRSYYFDLIESWDRNKNEETSYKDFPHNLVDGIKVPKLDMSK